MTSLVAALMMTVVGASVGGTPIAALLHRTRRDLRAAWRALHEDDLTGLANRRAFLAYLDCARTDGRPIAVALLDVNQFKKVNDNYGHEAGDRVLCALADRLRSVPYPVLLCARLAGDEFVVVIEGDTSAAITVARYVWEIIPATPVDIGDHQLAVTVSIGVAAASGIGYDQVLRNADRAMYEAKATGCGVSVEQPPVRAGAVTAESVAPSPRTVVSQPWWATTLPAWWATTLPAWLEPGASGRTGPANARMSARTAFAGSQSQAGKVRRW